MLRVILEFMRIIFLLLLLGAFFGYVLETLYGEWGVDLANYGWMGTLGVLLIIFVLYRNKLQWSGWYQGAGRANLSRKATLLLLSISALCILLPALLSFAAFGGEA